MSESHLPAAPLPGSRWRQLIYLLLSISGAVLTADANIRFARQFGGFELQRFIADAFGTAAGQSLSWDLLVGAFAVVMWMVVEARRISMRHAIWPILMTMGIAFAAGAPMFLLLRERHLNRMAAEGHAD
ncbi:MAG: DUF2834 domain-containing protein [Synechococcus sp. MED-G71]|jgi:hypothetical protein|nr:MAG: DUF2834 domain-containing protein [Synechococcus sp. MED-G71]|tara:strand:+ start:15369 stop:15755 length:387 start_codon:yes stop_codon:yes gene_type:complete